MTQSSLLDVPPTLLSVTWTESTNKIIFTFDRPMIEDSVEGADIFCRLDGFETTLENDAWLDSTTLQFDTTLDTPDAGPDVVTWLFPPTNIFSTVGFELPAFTNFPVFAVPEIANIIWTPGVEWVNISLNTAMNMIPIDGNEFTVRKFNTMRELTFSLWITATLVRFTTTATVPDVGVDEVIYSGNDTNFESVNNLPVQAFTFSPF